MSRRPHRRDRGWWRAALLVTFVALVAAEHAPLSAQSTGPTPFVPQGHWSLEAARRLHAMGLMPPGYDPAVSAQLTGALAAAFTAAAERSPLAESYRDRLAEELGSVVGGQATWLGFGYREESGRLYTGTGYEGEERPWHPSIRMASVSSPVAAARHMGSLGSVAWGAAGGIAAGGGLELSEAYVLGGWRWLGVWGGVRGLGMSTGPGTSVVLESLLPRPGAGVHLLEPVVLPWFLGHLGPVQATTHAVRAGGNWPYENPWIWATRVAMEPHSRLQVGLSRAMMLGGEGNQAITPRRFLMAAIGMHTSTFSNQLFSVSLRYRPPLAGWPVAAYVDWGMEDSSGSWWRVPGILGGVELASLPFAPGAWAGGMMTVLAESCCGNPIWYRNWKFNQGWADDGRLLGHALGGHGRELRLYGGADLADARVQVSGRLFHRDRGHENVYAPEREGRSLGVGVEALVVPAVGWQLYLGGSGEAGLGSDWREHSIELGVRGRL